MHRNDSLGAATIDLILGSDFTALNAVGATSSPTTNLTQTYGGIRGNVSICQDKKAFSAADIGH
jgi:hypothetical protein